MRSASLVAYLVSLAATTVEVGAFPHALALPKTPENAQAGANANVATVTNVVTVHTTVPAKGAKATPAADRESAPQDTSGASNADADGSNDAQPAGGAADAGTDSGAAPANSTRGAGGIRLAAWWGSSGATDGVGLDKVCAGDSIDAVLLAFAIDFFGGPGGKPVLGFTKNPSSLAPAIRNCQARGKKVLLSLGGATASGLTGKSGVKCTFSSDAQGSQFAQTLWDQFLGGSGAGRPFGDIKLDGIDIDNESGNPTGYDAFAKSLRANFAKDASRQYLLTAAPGCDPPSKSIPTSVLRQCDYVWAQFYDNPDCAHGSAGFTKAVKEWSQVLAGSPARLSVGGTAHSGSRGFLAADALANTARQVKGMNLPNFGGYALWDASMALTDAGDLPGKLKAALG